MKLYLAAPYSEKDFMTRIVVPFEADGHHITHKWWKHEKTIEESTPEMRMGQALDDARGVADADVLVMFNLTMSEGKAVEQGIAIAHSKPILAVGKAGEHSRNVFHFLAHYKWVAGVDEAIEVLRVLEWIGYGRKPIQTV